MNKCFSPYTHPPWLGIIQAQTYFWQTQSTTNVMRRTGINYTAAALNQQAT
jgi:hypothetical protein